PVNFKAPDGSWQAIDTRLQSDGHGGVVDPAAPGSVHLGGTAASSPLARVGAARTSLSFVFGRIPQHDSTNLVTPLPAPGVVSGDGSDTLTYSGAFANVDVRYQELATGVKEAIVLNTPLAPTLQPAFRFTVNMAGLRAQTAADGTVQFVDA